MVFSALTENGRLPRRTGSFVIEARDRGDIELLEFIAKEARELAGEVPF
jgi:hypothetical protein